MSLSAQDSLAARRTFGVEDIFFSTTDPKGVITHANDVFLRLAALDAASATGSAHNVIRHPEMPGGLFRLLWDELEAGRPVCAYMANQAVDGVRYDVLATVTPIEGGYLSVRLRPAVVDLERSVHRAYDVVTRRERELRETGGSRHAVAQQGADLLLAQLDELGFASAAEFTRHVLPREIEEFIADLPPVRTGPAPAGPLGTVLTSARALAASADSFAERLRDYENLALRVLQEREKIAPLVAELSEIGAELSSIEAILGGDSEADDDGEATQVRDLTSSMVGWNGEAIAGLEKLPVELSELQTTLRHLALRIAMFVLLSHTVAQFTSEVIASGQDRATELRLLRGALEQSLAQVEAETEVLKERLARIPVRVEEAVRSSDKVKLRVDGWHKRVVAVLAEPRFDGDHADGVALADSVARRLGGLFFLGEIVGLSTRMRQTPVRFDIAQAREQLQHIAGGLAALD